MERVVMVRQRIFGALDAQCIISGWNGNQKYILGLKWPQGNHLLSRSICFGPKIRLREQTPATHLASGSYLASNFSLGLDLGLN